MKEVSITKCAQESTVEEMRALANKPIDRNDPTEVPEEDLEPPIVR